MRAFQLGLAVAVLGAALVTGALPVSGQAEPTAAVAMGDSYGSGEAGRWDGNSSTNTRDRRGTDRAAYRSGWFWRYDPNSIYGTSGSCHRSDTAPIVSADLAVDIAFNLACSGASTSNLLPAAAGGVGYNAEAPQIDQLSAVAATHDVQVVVISVGGNDLDFADVIIDCVARYTTSPAWWPNTCRASQEQNLNTKLPAAMTGVRAVLDQTRAVLDANGDSDARIILQGYPSPVAESDSVRYAETGWKRTFSGGCPFWDTDLDWANDSLIPQITAGLAQQASDAGAEFLDLSDALKGHEACAGTASQGTSADGADAEWVRYITTGIRQGDAEESAHPNAYGQRAMGRCIALAVASPSPVDRCVNTPGAGTQSMRLG